MNKKLLCAALLGGLGMAHAASAQEFDDRWYLTGSVGYNFQDGDRRTDDAPMGTIGFGKFLSPSWSLDLELNYQNPNLDEDIVPNGEDLNWSQYGVSLDFRRHFVSEGRAWNPYVLFGVGYQRAEEEYATLSPNSPAQREDGNLAAKVGLGLQGTFTKRATVRAEVAYRADFDDTSYAASAGTDAQQYPHNQSESYFGDAIASIGIVIPLGPEPTAPVTAAPAPTQSCADLDSDGDGVNDCDDKCPNSQPGQAVGPDGCPVNLTIDLRGVNFDFDKSTLRPDAVSILNEAIEILKRYPELKVEVAGHTDSKGTDAYNQSLSERRAKAVYDYLTGNGIDAGRLVGPVGYGESRPIAPNTNADGSDNPEGRARNRRTELNVQN